MEKISEINSIINNFVWGPYMLVFLVGTGIYLTIRTGFFQISKFSIWSKKTYGSIFDKSQAGSSNVTPFQAVSVALASTIGIGSIAGIATAVVSGGPGALFWMFVSAFFGMVTKYSEVALAVYFRNKDKDGVYFGGPMYYIEKGIKQKWLAVIFAMFASIATFGIGNLTQSNAIASLVNDTFNLPKIAVGIVVAIVVALVIIGGIKRISSVSEKLVPFMALFYFIASLVVIFLNVTNIPSAIKLIFDNAFNLKAGVGGIGGYTIIVAMRYGIARGVFSNEAGLGTAPIVHAASNTKNPIEQGMMGIFEVFNTLIICIMTGLIILTSNQYLSGELSHLSGALLTSAAFQDTIGIAGKYVVTIASILFALSTLIGWSYYGDACLGYLTNRNKGVIMVYKVLYVLVVVVGATVELDLVWAIADTFNGLMAIPNLIALLILSPIVIKLTKKYIIDPKSAELEDK